MKLGYKALALATSMLFADPAVAADLGGQPSMKDYGELAPPMGWGGFSAALGVGATFSDNQFTFADNSPAINFGDSGFTALGRLQYDWQLGHFVFGPYVDLSYTGSNSSYLDSHMGYGAGVELGYVDGAGKIYTKFGWERSHLKYSDANKESPTYNWDVSKDRDALRVGGGLEFKVSRRLVLFAEGDIDFFSSMGTKYRDMKVESTDLTALAGIRIPFN
jgi:hypothetical protein